MKYGLDGIETNYFYRRHRAYTRFYSPEEIKKIYGRNPSDAGLASLTYGVFG